MLRRWFNPRRHLTPHLGIDDGTFPNPRTTQSGTGGPGGPTRDPEDTGHLVKYGDRHLAYYECCCGVGVNKCCFSNASTLGNVRCTISECLYAGEGCTGSLAPPDEFTPGYYFQVNGGDDIDEDLWGRGGAEQTSVCQCWVTKEKIPIKYVQWNWLSSTDPPIAGCPPPESNCHYYNTGSYYISVGILTYEHSYSDPGQPESVHYGDAWWIGYHEDRRCGRNETGTSVGKDRTWQFELGGGNNYDGSSRNPVSPCWPSGCCGDEMDNVECHCHPAPPLANHTATTLRTLDFNVNVTNNHCCQCDDTLYGSSDSCVLTHVDPDELTLAICGEKDLPQTETNQCVENDFIDQNELCP